jgi:hypothetical protein
MYTKLMKCLEVLDETKWLTVSDICFGDDPIKTQGKFFIMTPAIVQQFIRAFRFMLSSEPTKILKSQSGLKSRLDVSDT